MIVSIPNYKIIKHNISSNVLNEGFFDDIADEYFQDTYFQEEGERLQKEYEEERKHKVEAILKQLDILSNYDIICSGHGILVDIHDNLFLPNRGLNRFDTDLFKFNIVEGNCNFSNNNLTNWDFFPNIIKGNCYANFNNIKNFNGVPSIGGTIFAERQKKRTDYPLTQENYDKFKSNKLTENSVYAIPVNRFGELYSICEEDNSCIVQFNNNTKQKFNLNQVEYLGNIENLLI